ncbi:YceD family protein [Desulfurivibrio alkaliphilus]|uniref:DUF177 domain-containing protein n=1 Tax=Desulfurivibrio alkaliphilus (strain DSM 19089 / UNIQEM U267 / AHT2) TaxID=589865 RepID=D6Z363_DESAT|nr:DUF177 domain-containing protein [Desulfurivibrio alkaliphilus]ADH85988.1 protein of unknown function DUF177 [Desulfurivibrio alkaliphilus AHT 2]
MQIRFTEIPPQGLTLELTDQSWFPDHELGRHGVARATVALSREGERVVCAGRLEVTVSLSCDRCLEAYRYPLAAEFRLRLELSAPDNLPPAVAREHSCSREEMDTVFLAEELVDLGDLLSQQLYLNLPAKSLCRAECRGLCPRCGADLNQGDCGCATKGENSPFAALRVLKKT